MPSENLQQGPNPTGLCMCGCGQPAPVAEKTNQHEGYVRGQAKRYIYGHHRLAMPAAFWKRVQVGEPDECWEWKGSINHSGYGRFSRGNFRRGAHRVSWELANGPVPEGLCVLHRCDNPPCVNPAHLFLGTRGENAADRDAKGRTWNGGLAKTHCKHGHPFSGENLHTDAKGHRRCRACGRAANRRARANSDLGAA